MSLNKLFYSTIVNIIQSIICGKRDIIDHEICLEIFEIRSLSENQKKFIYKSILELN